MHSSLVRIQNVFGFFTSAAFAVAAAVALSTFLFTQNPTADVSLRNVQVVKGRPHYYSPKKEEYAHIKFDLEADFSSLFNWNTKQLFVWVTATYPSNSPSSPPSEAVIWDLIINSPSQLDSPWTVENLKSYVPFLPEDKKAAKAKAAKAKAKAKAAASKAKQAIKGEEPAVGKLSLKNVKPKYQVTDITGKLAEKGNVTLEVGWNVQPWVGALWWTLKDGQSLGRWQGVKGGRSKAFDMPALKAKKGESVVGQKATPKAGKAEPVVGR